MMRESFIQKIDDSLEHCGYSDRSAFIRDAVYEKLRSMGMNIEIAEKNAPPRAGKGGRKPKPSTVAQNAVEQENDNVTRTTLDTFDPIKKSPGSTEKIG